MSKLYNEQKIVKLDPLGSRLDDVGLTGGVGRLNKLKLRKTKKIIQKTPNKKFKSETTPGKTQKKISFKRTKKHSR